ncbi:glycosyltransferase family 2 protein [Pleionea sediminis]|uniref:glycosyltransferase family 2 protein n=1 Tax=Pleionea sediminis TaxID=2569479 RepID=UPI0011851097|nr:glycosyltransferase family 2 protein [Pleionea sediminis]
MNIKSCVIIPVYNHYQVIEKTVSYIVDLDLFVILIDDGSNTKTHDVLLDLESKFPNVYLETLPNNQGKGAAVMTGLYVAESLGFTHAIQVDADGQHTLSDIEHFLIDAEKNPDSVICGYPSYDESVPKHRFYARYLTHVWVWIECLSLHIKDSMCGFRVYPLSQTISMLSRNNVGKRMDFDTEILVKLFWDRVNIVNKPTKVIYPEGGVSQFNLVRDNWLITKMHTRLFLGMLIRSPFLLARNLFSKLGFSLRKKELKETEPKQSERGSRLGMTILFYCFRWFGVKFVKLLLYPIIFYYFLFSPQQRKHSYNYLNKLYRYSNKDLFSRKPSFWDGFKHFYSFGEINADKFATWAGEFDLNDIVFENEHLIEEIRQSGKGALFLVSHIGNIDTGRALSMKYKDVAINNIVSFNEAPIFNNTLEKISQESTKRLFMVSELGIETGIILKKRLDQGEIIVIAGDRIANSGSERTISTKFLGVDASFSAGPFKLAGVLECPIYTFCSLKRNGRYHIYMNKLCDASLLTTGKKKVGLKAAVGRYAAQLEQYCEIAPYQWFNFFDFWKRR